MQAWGLAPDAPPETGVVRRDSELVPLACVCAELAPLGACPLLDGLPLAAESGDTTTGVVPVWAVLLVGLLGNLRLQRDQWAGVRPWLVRMAILERIGTGVG